MKVSTDKSGRLCDELMKKYPNIIKSFHKKNEGLLMTRRYGYKVSRGMYIINCDSDDFVETNLLSSLSPFLDGMQTTLLIMAAGIGSRFGGGIKQLEPVDETGHIIMDYSIHDAIEAGFNKVVFIIRKDIENEFKEVIGDRIAGICSEHNVTVG